MKKTLLTTIVALAIFLASTAQNLEWVNGIGGTNTDQAHFIATDASGNVYTTGKFKTTVDFDNGPNTVNLNSNDGEVFITKHDANGNLLWAKNLAGANSGVNKMIIDNTGNVIVTGYFGGTADFNPDAATYNLTSNGQLDAFIIKLNTSGNLVWAKNIGGSAYDQGIGLTSDASGNVYVTGFFQGMVDFNPGSGTYNLTSSGTQSEAYILKLNASGNFIWAKQFNGPGSNAGNDIAVDASGNVYTTGSFWGTTDFNPGSGTNNLIASGTDLFISKLNASGNFVWAKKIGNSYNNVGKAITIDASDNVFIAGRFRGTADFNPGSGTNNLTSNGNSDLFVLKLDNAGDYVWAKHFGGSSNDNVEDITLDATGNIYFTGSFKYTADFDPSSGTLNLVSEGSSDVFVAKLNTLGNLRWAFGIGAGANDIGYSIAVDASENVYSTGYFQSTVDFEPDTSNTTNLISNGYQDIFIAKYSQTPPCANIVNIPDANFKNALLNHSPVIDTDGDGEICETEAQAFTGTLSVNGSGPSTEITDLTGIESFTSITTLRCFNNDLNSLDVTNNTALIELHFGGNNVSSIDLSQNSALQILFCNSNNLSSLDVSNNLALQSLSCYENNLTQIDISLNTSIRQFRCYSNMLTSLNIANGNNSNFDWMTAGGNPGLSCIQHDTGFDPTTDSNFTKDATASWSDDCSVILVNSITVQGANGVDTVELGNLLQMEAMVLPANADDQTYSWSITVNTGDASINTNGQLIPQAIGNVTVLAAANDGSGVVGTKTITIIDSSQTSVGIRSVVGFETISVYPNPATNYITIETGNENITSIRLLDVTGKIVKTFNPTNQKLNVSNINKGIYLLEVANAEKHAIVKLVLQ